MLQEKLKAASKGKHDRLEQLMLVDQIMQKKLTQQEYKQVLLTNYLIHRNYEKVIHENIRTSRLNLKSREKIRGLELDLQEAGLAQKNIDNTLPLSSAQITSQAFAMGAMYVLEGATLGGSVIKKQLVQNPNFPAEMGLHYYNSYGQQLMENWKTFVQELNNLPEEMHENVIDGANWLFDEIANTSIMLSTLDEIEFDRE